MSTNNAPIRLARQDELPKLPLIEQAAAIRFRETPYAYLDADEPSVELPFLQEQQTLGLVWVAVDTVDESVDEPVGFAVAEVVDGELYLHELDVHPAHGQRGLGRRLVATVCDYAASAGYPAVTLSTFRDVAWNAPFYARLGFREVLDAELTPGLQDVRQAEAEAGLPLAQRVIMRLRLAGMGGF